MALATSDTKAPAPMMGAGTVNPTAVAPLAPTLADDVDPVLLIRLFPDEIDATGLRAAALAQGVATMAAGATLVAAQQEPVVVLGAEPVPAPHPAPVPAPRANAHPAPHDDKPAHPADKPADKK